MSFRESLSQLVAEHPKKVFVLLALAAVSPAVAGIVLTVVSQSLPRGEVFGNCNSEVFDRLKRVAPGEIGRTIRENCELLGRCGEHIAHVNTTFADELCAAECRVAYLLISDVFRFCSSNSAGGAGGFLLLTGGFSIAGSSAYVIHQGLVPRVVDSVKDCARGAAAFVGSLFRRHPVSPVHSEVSEGQPLFAAV